MADGFEVDLDLLGRLSKDFEAQSDALDRIRRYTAQHCSTEANAYGKLLSPMVGPYTEASTAADRAFAGGAAVARHASSAATTTRINYELSDESAYDSFGGLAKTLGLAQPAYSTSRSGGAVSPEVCAPPQDRVRGAATFTTPKLGNPAKQIDKLGMPQSALEQAARTERINEHLGRARLSADEAATVREAAEADRRANPDKYETLTEEQVRQETRPQQYRASGTVGPQLKKEIEDPYEKERKPIKTAGNVVEGTNRLAEFGGRTWETYQDLSTLRAGAEDGNNDDADANLKWAQGDSTEGNDA